ncbi:MAG: peptide chain release factor N(5)-glutamine methyltransferase, partial [Parahaliea sp.]
MSTVRQLLAQAAGIESDDPRRDAEVLLCHCLGCSRTALYTWPEKAVDAGPVAQFHQLLARRAAGEPVAHLTGGREFWRQSLQVSADTLIPRPDTETLVEWALELPLAAQARVLDLGTGTGAIAIALAVERPQWRVSATDVSAAALVVARRNAGHCCPGRLRLHRGDWFAAVAGERFELVVSNPPYLAAGDPHLQRGDLRFEPRAALVAGEDGLAAL